MENKNLLIAILLSLAIVIGFQFFYKGPSHVAPKPQQTEQAQQAQTSAQSPSATAGIGAPPVPTGAGAGGTQTPLSPSGTGTTAPVTPINLGSDRASALAQSPRIPIKTPALHGSIALKGGKLDDLTLARYRETLDPNSPEIVLFSPLGSAAPYFADVGWVSPGNPSTPLPGPDTLWTAQGSALTPETPLTLVWDNGQGLIFKRTFSIDDNYMFTVRQTVESASDHASLPLVPYSLVSRYGTPPTSGYFILFEGPLGVFNDRLEEIKYKTLVEKGSLTFHTTSGWIGITDKYWLSALVPNQEQPITARFVHQKIQDTDQYQVDFVAPQQVLAPGAKIEAESQLFAGAKVVRLIDAYQRQYSINRFDLAIDWGWFYFLTRPTFYALEYIKGIVGNFGIAILIFTVLLKLLFFPLANKSYRSMSRMRKLQPEMMRLKEIYGDDRARLNQEMMGLYKREKVNPASGCLPMLVQIPVFFALYKVLFVTIEMRHAPFFGWIHDLSAPDPTTIVNLFGLIPWTPPNFLHIGAWPLIMGITMFFQQRLNPQPPDPIQAKMFMLLPVVFTFMLAHFPAGLVIYWTWNNFLSIIQQWVIMKRMGVKV